MKPRLKAGSLSPGSRSSYHRPCSACYIPRGWRVLQLDSYMAGFVIAAIRSRMLSLPIRALIYCYQCTFYRPVAGRFGKPGGHRVQFEYEHHSSIRVLLKVLCRHCCFDVYFFRHFRNEHFAYQALPIIISISFQSTIQEQNDVSSEEA